MPPFVDTRLLAGPLLEAGLRRLPPNRARLRRRARLRAGDGPAPARYAPEWTLEREGGKEPAIVWRPGGYTSLWIRAHARGFENPKQAPSLGLERPWLRITLVPSEGEPIEMCLSERGPANEAWLWNRRTNVLMRIEGELAAEMAPEASAFTDTARANPWERWLMR
jgi:hypothetical protein